MNCTVCGSSQWKYLFRSKDRMFELPGKFAIYRCRNCGLLRLAPKISSKRFAAYYPSQKYYSYLSCDKPGPFWRLRMFLVARKNFVSRVLSQFIHVPAIPGFRNHGRIMDIGCGTGDTLVQLRELGWDAYGVDIDKKAIGIAHQRGLIHVRLGSYTSLKNYPDGFFDVIRLYHVIEHIDSPNSFLELAHKKIKKGGELIIGTPNADSLVAKFFGTYWYNLDSPRHLFIFSPRTLKRILTAHKFSMLHVDFCSIGGIVGSVQYILKEKLGIQKKIIHNAWAVILVYPLERILDWCRVGDVFILHVKK